jgi:alpha-ketoglutarate-dependent taurine dioxygenase
MRDGYWVGRTASEDELTGLAVSLGEPIAARLGGPVLQELVPIETSAAPRKSLSAVHGVEPFPFHTDGAHYRRPPRWIVMRCVDPGPGGRPTLLVDGARLPLGARQWRDIERAVWWVRSGARSFPASIMTRSHQGTLLRYDRGCMEPSVPEFARVGGVLESAIEASEHIRLTWKPNDVVVVDNWRILHARGAASRLDRGARRLQRILVR